MTDLPVLAAGQRREVTLDGTTYAVRALTYAEHSALQLARAAQRAPSPELINAALRTEAEKNGRADLAEAITAQEEAEDALAAFWNAAPPALDEEGRRLWLAEQRDELTRLQRDLLRADRGRRMALELFGTSDPVAKLREAGARAMRAAALDLIVAGVAAIDGTERRLTTDQAAALPSAHVSALAEAISALLMPGRDAAKN